MSRFRIMGTGIARRDGGAGGTGEAAMASAIRWVHVYTVMIALMWDWGGANDFEVGTDSTPNMYSQYAFSSG